MTIKEGRIVEKGTPGELVKKGGIYANMWKKQFSKVKCYHQEAWGSSMGE